MVQRKVKFSWIKAFLPITLLFLAINSPFVVLAHSQTQVIEMTTNGFVPQEVTIDESSSVIFINKDSVTHWPASDIHPTHEIYPEFDPKKGIEQGKSWTFKFTRVGEWSLHDHLFPHFRGKITVLVEAGGNSQQTTFPLKMWEHGLDQIKEVINQLINKITSLFKFTKQTQLPDPNSFMKLSYDSQQKILEGLDGQKAWEFVKTTFKGTSGSSGNIHDLAHLSGTLLYQDKGFTGLAFCSADFAFGCFHGFLDEAFRKNLDHLLDAQNACLKLGQAGSGPPEASLAISGPVASCIHGIGHGIASFYSTTDIKKALSSCRKLTSGVEYCFDGVFMEFVRSAPPSFFKKEDTLYPCDSLEKEFGYTYSSACGRNQPSLLLGRFKMSFEQVIPVCLSSPSAPFKQSCIDSLGFSLASSQDSEKIIQGCQIIGDREYIKRCIKAAAGELVFQDAPGWEQKSKVVCESLPDSADECLSYVNKLASDYHRVRN